MLLGFELFQGGVYGLDVSPDGSIVIGSGDKVVIAHSTATRAILWQKQMPVCVRSLRIHGGVVVVPVNNSNMEVLDVSSGRQLYTLPPAGRNIVGICMFDGLTSDAIGFADFFMPCYHLSANFEDSLESGRHYC
jgi:hypothetical protein